MHVAAFATKAGFSDEQIRAMLAPERDADLWTAEPRDLLAMVDELHTTANLSSTCWQRLRQHFDEPQLSELIMLAGRYHAVGFIVKGLRIEAEAFAPGFPASP